MNYFALFFDDDTFVENCLSLIRFISNPESRTFPHVTISLYDKKNNKLEYTRETVINSIEIIGPGTFNVNENSPPFVVYIRCSSDRLEEIKYKPDFPSSRLHITLYEGQDYYFATKLYDLLKNITWKFTLTFEKPRPLYEKTIGSTKDGKKFLRTVSHLLKEILDVDLDDFKKYDNDINYRLSLINTVLHKLDKHLNNNSSNSYITNLRIKYNHASKFIDASNEDITYNTNQLSFDSIYSSNAPFIEKPVQDAIFITPPEYARAMAICAIDAFGDSSKAIYFGDSAIGTGALFLALKSYIGKLNKKIQSHYVIESAIGIDIDKGMATEAFLRCQKHGLTVIHGDAISPTIDIGSPRNMMIINPPYNRHENIPHEYKVKASLLAKRQTGIKISGDAGLYTYHLLIMDKWLSNDGIAVWLLPSIFLQARYGYAIRKYLLENVKLLRLHVYDDQAIQFDNANISTTIVVFSKKATINSNQVLVSYGDSVEHPVNKKYVDISDLKSESSNWRKIISSNEIIDIKSDFSSANLVLEEFFDIKRGIATGANSFFTLHRDKAKEFGIPEVALKPLLPKARFLSSKVINAQEDGYPAVDPQLVLIDSNMSEMTIKTEYPEFYNYLQTAKVPDKYGKTITERTLVKSRTPWYRQEKREPPPYLLTYMGRTKKDRPALYFILNKSNALALNTYLLLYPKRWLGDLIKNNPELANEVLESLNKSAELIEQQARIYSGGLQKLEPGELKKLPIVNFPANLLEAYEAFNNR